MGNVDTVKIVFCCFVKITYHSGTLYQEPLITIRSYLETLIGTLFQTNCLGKEYVIKKKACKRKNTFQANITFTIKELKVSKCFINKRRFDVREMHATKVSRMQEKNSDS